MMRIGSLFSGIGGLEMGLQIAVPDSEVLWQAEREPYALAVLNRHWPAVRRYTDVRDINERTARVDVVCGGFPCQPHSSAGKRRGTDDERWIWPEFKRIVDTLRPTYVFIENVPGLRTSGLSNVLSDLAQIWFDAEWDIFGACCVGAPHRRERLFILASNSDADCHRLEKNPDEDVICPTTEDAQYTRYFGSVGSAGKWIEPRPIGARPMGVGNGVRSDLDRIKCLGNAVVPRQAALAWTTLIARSAQRP